MSSEMPERTLRSFNPATLEPVGQVAVSPPDEILSRVCSARKAFLHWSALSIEERLRFIARFRDVLVQDLDETAETVTRETGKPLVESLSGELFGPMETCVWLLRNAVRLLAPQPVSLNRLFFPGKKSYNVFEPLGVVAIISPWNYPFAIPVSTMLAALAAGNTVVLKPSPKTPAVTQAIMRAFARAGFPEGVVEVVYGDRDEAKALVLADVDRVVFTGSVPGGRAIMSLAAEKLHPVTLELGGKHAAIVLRDADVESAAAAIVWGAFTNAGQACVSIERVYVEAPLARALSLRIAELSRGLRLGNGLDPDTQVGPLIDAQQLERVRSLLDDATAHGARVIAGGRARPDLGGHFFEPTVLVNCKDSMRVMKEEIFGPLLSMVVVNDADEAVDLTNASDFGLGASIWTADLPRAERLARRVRAGMVWVNDSIYSHICPDAPWGGVKDSGFGRTHGSGSLLEFVYVKHVGVGRQGRQDWHYPYSQERLALIRSGMQFCHAPSWSARLRSLFRLIPSWLKTRR